MNQSFEVIEKCDLCGGAKFASVDEAGHIMRCIQCGFKFTNPRKILSANIDDMKYRTVNDYSKRFRLEEQLPLYVRRCAIVRHYVPKGRLLDVGAGAGVFLHMCQSSDSYELFGTEVIEYYISFAKEKFGLKMDLGTLEEIDYPAEYFDAVTLWHVLEHVPSPAETIKEISRILKKNGLIFIAVPNDSWLGRSHFFKNALKQLLHRFLNRKIFKIKKMYPVYEEEGNWHLSHFTPKTLKLLLKRNGFKVRKLTIDEAVGFDIRYKNVRKKKVQFTSALWVKRLTGLIVFDAMLIVAEKTS